MDFEKLKSERAAAGSGIPPEYADREQINISKFSGELVNDAPCVVIEKPKQEKQGGVWKTVYNKDGRVVRTSVAFIPALVGGKKILISASSWETVGVLKGACEGDGEVIRGEGDMRVVRWILPDVFEGTLKVVPIEKTYRDGSKFSIMVLDCC